MALLLVSASIAVGQTIPSVFEAPWRGFDTGSFGNGFLPKSAAMGDMDGDGDTDVLVGQGFAGGFENGGTGVSVLINRGDGTFLLPVYYALPQGQSVAEVALNDFDADGDLDAFAAILGSNFTQTKVLVWRNNSNGTLAPRIEFPTGVGPLGIVVADFTGDGKADIVTANSNFNARDISLLQHNGQTGTATGFLPPVNFSIGMQVKHVAAADLNGDNKLDLVVGGAQNSGISFLSVLINNGTGGFGAPIAYEAAPGAIPSQTSTVVALKDLDNDGDADLLGGAMYDAGGSISRGAVTIRRNSGDGIFGNHEIYMYGNYVDDPYAITTGDINGDGFADIIACTPSGRTNEGFVTILSNGTGGFHPPVNYDASQWTYSILSFDSDGDGDLDIVTVAGFSNALTLHNNPGNGNLFVPTRYPLATLNDAVESADIDHDGDIDIITNNETSIVSPQGVVMVLKNNNGSGTFANAVSYIQPRNFADMKLRDINGDGFVDLVLGPDGLQPPYHFGTSLNNGDGTFAATVVTPVFSCGDGSIDAFDLDNDGDRDVVLTEEQGCAGAGGPRIFLFRNDGNQVFSAMAPISAGAFAVGIAGGDVNGDGRVDLITSVTTGIGVFPNLNNNFTFGPVIVSSTGPYKFKVADFNGDDKLDVGMILAQSYFGVDVGTALGNGDGTFAAVQTQHGSSTAESLRISDDIETADFNGDGKLDVLTLNYASNDLSLFLNNGTGGLLPHQRYGVSSTPHFGTAADFNGDSKPDFAASIGLRPSGIQGALVVIRNISARNSKTKFDFDGDGKADIGVFRQGNWYLQESQNGFRAVNHGLATDKLTPADYDGDGKADIAVFRDGDWYVVDSGDNQSRRARFGMNGDVPVPGDYDGDGRDDIAVFRPSTGDWYLLQSTTGFVALHFGQSGDVPVAGDYDGDGKCDVAVYRSGIWYVQRSRDGFYAVQFGVDTDLPVVGDFDGDGRADPAVFRSGVWYVQRSRDGFYAIQFGLESDVPTPADYDGDGITDVGVFRDGNWYIQRSQSGFVGVQFGMPEDEPLQNAFMP